MHEKRNFVMVILLLGSTVWAVAAWIFMRPEPDQEALLFTQRAASILLIASLGLWLFYSLKFEDKLPDHLRQHVGDLCYEADGVSFKPLIRVRDGHAELCLYYQNRYENMVEAIVHLRPPDPLEGGFALGGSGMSDVHFAFRADGGDFGVIHQPIAVPRHLQGEVLPIKMAASSWYPRSHGARLRKRAGMPCGTLPVDWVGNPLKVGVHEVSNDIPLTNPVTLHLAMPIDVASELKGKELWRQQRIEAGGFVLA